jgi:three-Cys-motif partner protein
MSSKSEYRIANDGYPARLSGRWAVEKLDAAHDYLHIVAKAMKTKWSVSFVDLLAGCGRCIQSNKHEFDGSPLIALKCTPSFASVVLVEQEPTLVAALKARTASYAPSPTIIASDCNDLDTISAIREAVPSNNLGVVFVDNLGLDVTFRTLKRLTYQRRMDLLITFQVSTLRRNAGRAYREAALGSKWDNYFGDPGWRQVIEQFEARKISAPDLGVALGDFYGSQLGTLGYGPPTQLPRPMKNRRNGQLYRVMLFSKHPLGSKLFTAISKSKQQPSLLDSMR